VGFPAVPRLNGNACQLLRVTCGDGLTVLLLSASTLIGVVSARAESCPTAKDDIATEPSNSAFDADLKRRNPAWGLRRYEEFAAAAAPLGFTGEALRPMPANNGRLNGGAPHYFRGVATLEGAGSAASHCSVSWVLKG